MKRYSSMAGFSLVELMLSLSLGVALSGVMLQGLVADGHQSGRLSRLMRERAWQRRTLALIGTDLQHSSGLSATPEQEAHACNLAGRQPLLHLHSAAGSITYSIGPPPSAIWRGHVLMRCGPAYGLDGSLSQGTASQNRVVLDGLSSSADPCGSTSGQPLPAVEVCLDPHVQLLKVRLVQQFPGVRPILIKTEKHFGV